MPKLEIDESFLEIDSDKLDEEWLNQPDLFFKYAKLKAKTDRELDEAKSELDVVEAELDKAIRNRPEKYDLIKITDKSIEKAILREASYQNALDALNDAKYKSAILDAAVKALDHRKRALENLVFLHGQNYFSSPRANDETKEFARDAERKQRPKSRLKARDEDD
jgi:hypothetical protein